MGELLQLQLRIRILNKIKNIRLSLSLEAISNDLRCDISVAERAEVTGFPLSSKCAISFTAGPKLHRWLLNALYSCCVLVGD